MEMLHEGEGLKKMIGPAMYRGYRGYRELRGYIVYTMYAVYVYRQYWPCYEYTSIKR